MKFIFGVLVAAILFAMARGCGSCSASPSGNPDTSQPAISSEWYEGGTLHRGTMEEWKNGGSGDKLATAGDWVAYMREKLKSDIKPRSMDALRPLAAKLATCVEAAYDDRTANQKASDTAALCMASMGWLE